MNFDLNTLKSFGEDIFIEKNVMIKRPHLISMGSHIAIDYSFYITTGALLKNHIHISPFVAVIGGPESFLEMGNFTNISVGGRIICGSDSFLGEGLVTAPGIPNEYRDRLTLSKIVFSDFVNTGANVTIFPSVILGEGSVIGAGSVVTSDTEPWTIYTGVPAKPMKTREKTKMIEFAKRMGYEY